MLLFLIFLVSVRIAIRIAQNILRTRHRWKDYIWWRCYLVTYWVKVKVIKVGTVSENMHTFIWKENDKRQTASNGKTEIHAWCCRHDTSLIISSVYSIMSMPFTWILGPKAMWNHHDKAKEHNRQNSTIYNWHFKCKSLITFIAL